MKAYLNELSEGVNGFQFVEPAEEFGLQGAEFTCVTPISARLTVIKTGNTVLARGLVWTRILTKCSRCLKDFEEDLSAELDLIFKKRKGQPEEYIELSEEDLKTIEFDAEYIDLREGIRETLLLAFPIKPLCSQGCKGLCPVCGRDLNPGPCGCQRERIDPRWRSLESLRRS
ncbi:MAG TPA: DUF177 domain-containing protein [Candidatus Latescibacteria bacterium]|nr:DUF177 domain-containing protein [Candidatus Latescibacterota bacterium]